MLGFSAEDVNERNPEQFLDACNQAFGWLKADGKRWKHELTERQIWEQTLLDGLEGDEITRLPYEPH